MQVTVIRAQGDAEALHRVWREELLPVAGARAEEYGWQRSIVARSEDELIVVNLWSDAEGLDRAIADPEIDRIQTERLAPMGTQPFEVYRLEVVEDLDPALAV